MRPPSLSGTHTLNTDCVRHRVKEVNSVLHGVRQWGCQRGREVNSVLRGVRQWGCQRGREVNSVLHGVGQWGCKRGREVDNVLHGVRQWGVREAERSTVSCFLEPLAPLPFAARLPPPDHDRGHVRRGESESAIPSPITMVVKGDRDHTRDRGPSTRARSVRLPARRRLRFWLGHLLSSAAAVAAALIRPASQPFVRRRRRFFRWQWPGPAGSDQPRRCTPPSLAAAGPGQHHHSSTRGRATLANDSD